MNVQQQVYECPDSAWQSMRWSQPTCRWYWDIIIIFFGRRTCWQGQPLRWGGGSPDTPVYNPCHYIAKSPQDHIFPIHSSNQPFSSTRHVRAQKLTAMSTQRPSPSYRQTPTLSHTRPHALTPTQIGSYRNSSYPSTSHKVGLRTDRKKYEPASLPVPCCLGQF